MKIKNGDLPAMPISCSESICQMTGSAKPEFSGLTKREMFAMAAMQGLLSKSTMATTHAAEYAVECADKLLRELERTK